MKTSEPPVVVEQSFNKSADIVWNAITKVDEMVQWFFENIPDFKAEVGFEAKFEVNTGERNFPH